MICETYQNAESLKNEVVISCSDEKTGIQALKHLQVEVMQKGKNEKKDPEYVRNGTTCLIASRNVLSGKINSFLLNDTRTEYDYLSHIQSIVSTDLTKKHIIICDQLNTHKSESLVRWIAQNIGYEGDLGEKSKFGILKSQQSRMEFLEDHSHSIRFLYTPKHCSWMNQIENWFGCLERKLIKKGEFSSVELLNSKISSFIMYYNEHLAKSYAWSFSGEKFRVKLTI